MSIANEWQPWNRAVREFTEKWVDRIYRRMVAAVRRSYDRTDRLGPSCKKALVLYTERPRYPYP